MGFERGDRRGPARSTFGKEGVSYPYGSLDFPVIVEKWNGSPNQALPNYLSPHPSATLYPGVVLVDQGSDPGNNQNTNIFLKYEVLPGAIIITGREKAPDGAVKITTRQKVRASTEPDGVCSVVTSPVTALAMDAVRGETLVMATREQTFYLNLDGTPRSFAVDGSNLPTGGNPILVKTQWVEEFLCDENQFRQLQPAPGVLPNLNATYLTGGVLSGGLVTAITVGNHGTAYSQVALVAVALGSGVRCIAHATMKALTATVIATGTGWVIGETTVVPGGTGTASVLTVATLGLGGFAISAPGTGYTIGQVATLTGGTHPGGAAALTVTALRVVALTNTGGTGYLANDVLTLIGGTGAAATITVLSLRMASGSPNAPGTDYLIGDTIVFAGGTFSAMGSALVSGVSLRSIALVNGGNGFANGDVLQLVGGTHTTTARLTVTANTAGVITAFTISVNGVYTATASSFTSTSVSPSAGSGATFNTPSWGIHDLGSFSGGNYTVGTATPTQDASSTTSGTGATFSGFLYGINTPFAITTGGSYTGTLPTSFTATGGAGSGATFNAPSWGVSTATISTPGSYTATATPLTHTSGLIVTPVWGASTFTVSTPGSLTALPPIALVTATKASAGANYAVGDTITLAGGIGTAPVLAVATITGTQSTGPIGTVSVTVSGPLTALPSTTDLTGLVQRANWTQAGTSGGGHGAEFTATYKVDVAGLTGSGTGTGAEAVLTYAVDAIAIDNAGTRYPGIPAVTITGSQGTQATATTAISATAITATAGIVVDRWREPTDGPMAWVHWVTMPVPATQVTSTSAQWVKPGTFSNAANIIHSPAWPGIDFKMTPALSAEFGALLIRTYSLGQLPNATDGSAPPNAMYQTFSLTTPGAGSRFFPIQSRTIHPAIEYISTDGTYAEIFEPSVMTGQYGTLIVISCTQKRARGYIYEMTTIAVDPANGRV